jgi:hypothetical protein
MSALQVSQVWSIVILVAAALGLAVPFAPQAVSAQRDDARPLCWSCHASEDPVVEQGEWHTIHALQRCCRACHGGNEHAADQAAAHAGLTLHPLDNASQSCQPCHPDDYRQRAEEVAVVLSITPASQEPTACSPVAVPTLTPPMAALLPQTSFQGWDWPVELAVAIVGLGLGVMRWRRVHLR